MPDSNTTRGQFLLDGLALTDNDRNESYGEPFDNFTNIALLWAAYLEGKYSGKTIGEVGFELTPEDVAWFNVLQKCARTFLGTVSADTYIDAAVYSAIAGEVRMKDEEE